MKNKVIILVAIIVVVSLIVCSVIFLNNNNNNDDKEQVATITVRYDYPHISDSGYYERYCIYRDFFHKYKYTKENANVTVGGMNDYEFEESGTIGSRKDLNDLFDNIYSNEVVNDEEDVKRMKEENNGITPFSLFNETYIYVFFEYNDEYIGEDIGGPIDYEEKKEIINRNYEQFENLLFK